MINALISLQPLSQPSQNVNLMRIAQAALITGLVLTGACQPKSAAQSDTTQSSPSVAAAEGSIAQAPAGDVAAPVASQAAPSRPVSPKSAVSKSEDSAAGGKAASISGGWVNAGGACDSGASVQFNADGTYMSEGENGTWALDGKTLTVTTASTPEAERVAAVGPEQSTGDSGEKAILTVLSVTDTAASVILSNGTNANWTRCSG